MSTEKAFIVEVQSKKEMVKFMKKGCEQMTGKKAVTS